MADTINEFYSQKGITYNDLVNGITIASTTGSQTAVIRDVAIKSTASKKVNLTIDNIEVATTSETTTLSGTELLEASQTLKIVPGQDLAWTGLIANTPAGYATKKYWTIDSSQYFDPPVNYADSDEMSLLSYANYNDRNGSWRSGGGDIPSGNTFNNGITIWPASNMFGKDADDLYFSRYTYYAMANNGQNQLYYYDDSAGSSTLVAGEETDRKRWHSGISNRYLIRPYASGSNFSKFDVYDTLTNTYTHDRMVRNYNNTSNSNIVNWSDTGSQISIMDQYVFVKNVHTSSGQGCALMDITTGAHISWNHHTTYSQAFCMQNGSYLNRPSYAQLAKDSNGKYYVLWMFIYDSSSTNAESGVQVIELGANPGALIAGNKGGSTYPNLQFRFNDSSYVSWTSWKLTDQSMQSYQHGWTSGFHPFKRITPTDSGSRYWLLLMYSGSYIIDLENPSATISAISQGTTGVTVKRNKWKTQSGSNSYTGGFTDDQEVGCLSLDYNGNEASASYGIFDVRCTGILST